MRIRANEDVSIPSSIIRTKTNFRFNAQNKEPIPMSINQQIADSIRRYPTLHSCRTSVLHHWFCVSGSGYGWDSGRLITLYAEPPLPSREETIQAETKSMIENLSMGVWPPDSLALRHYELRFEQEMVARRWDMAEELALVSWGEPRLNGFTRYTDIVPGKINPLCKFSCLAKIPNDVDPEYLEAAREMIQEIFRSQPWQSSRDGFRVDEKALAQHESNLEFADGIAQELAQRFGPGTKPNSLAEYRISLERRDQFGRDLVAKLRSGF